MFIQKINILSVLQFTIISYNTQLFSTLLTAIINFNLVAIKTQFDMIIKLKLNRRTPPNVVVLINFHPKNKIKFLPQKVKFNPEIKCL